MSYGMSRTLLISALNHSARSTLSWLNIPMRRARLYGALGKPPFLDRFGGSCYRKVATPRDDSGTEAVKLFENEELSCGRYQIAERCQAFWETNQGE